MESEPPATVSACVARVRERVDAAARRAARDPAHVAVCAAIKYADDEQVRQLIDAGVTDLAENRLDSLERRRSAFAMDAVRWHFIGRLQSRKAPAAAAAADVLHSLASESAAARLARAAEDGIELPQLLVQVNTARDPGKDGVLPDQLERFLDALPAALSVSGLMTMPALAHEPEASRAAFSELRELAGRMAASFGERHPVQQLSMGTSQDFEIAVEEGATHVRLGRILYAVEEYRPHDART